VVRDTATGQASQSRDAKGGTPHPRLGYRVGVLVDHFESAVYGIAFLLLVIAAVLVVIGGVQPMVQAATGKISKLEGGVLALDRILLVLIIGELAYTLRTVLLYREIALAAEPFLFIGLIATVRRILIVTAAFEQPHSDHELNRLLLQLGALGLLVLGIAAAIFMIRYSAERCSTQRPDGG
jgi:F0F1-type ATP synthase assembly protein I